MASGKSNTIEFQREEELPGTQAAGTAASCNDRRLSRFDGSRLGGDSPAFADRGTVNQRETTGRCRGWDGKEQPEPGAQICISSKSKEERKQILREVQKASRQAAKGQGAWAQTNGTESSPQCGGRRQTYREQLRVAGQSPGASGLFPSALARGCPVLFRLLTMVPDQGWALCALCKHGRCSQARVSHSVTVSTGGIPSARSVLTRDEESDILGWDFSSLSLPGNVLGPVLGCL